MTEHKYLVKITDRGNNTYKDATEVNPQLAYGPDGFFIKTGDGLFPTGPTEKINISDENYYNNPIAFLKAEGLAEGYYMVSALVDENSVKQKMYPQKAERLKGNFSQEYFDPNRKLNALCETLNRIETNFSPRLSGDKNKTAIIDYFKNASLTEKDLEKCPSYLFATDNAFKPNADVKKIYEKTNRTHKSEALFGPAAGRRGQPQHMTSI